MRPQRKCCWETDVVALANAVVDVRGGPAALAPVPALEQLQQEEDYDPPLLQPKEDKETA